MTTLFPPRRTSLGASNGANVMCAYSGGVILFFAINSCRGGCRITPATGVSLGVNGMTPKDTRSRRFFIGNDNQNITLNKTINKYESKTIYFNAARHAHECDWSVGR